MQLLRIDHETKLVYSEPVHESVVEVRMAPPSTEDQTVLGYRLRTTPPVPITTYRDGFGNRTELFTLSTPHEDMVIRTACCVRVHRRSGEERLAEIPWPAEATTSIDAIEFLRPSPLVEMSGDVQAFCASTREPKGTFLEAVETMMKSVRAALKYEKKVTAADTPVSEALKIGSGVCQDFAHLLLALARHWNLPARYVSGYINQPGELATHAWAQLWAGPMVGWVDIDPTMGKWVGIEHVVTAVGRDFSEVPPNRGVWKGNATETISVSVNVQPVDRVPLDLSDSGDGAAWTSSSYSPPSERSGGPPKDRLIQQRQRQAFRQQQSQQQQ